jgi:hypothetical protein
MLAWITEKFSRTDDSLASESGMRAFLETLPLSTPVVALNDIGERFAGAAELGLEPPACRRALLRMDEVAQGPVEQIWVGLFGDGLGKSMSDLPWQTLVNYQRNVFSGYSYCLEQMPAPAEIDAAGLHDAMVLANRAMAALASHKALMRIRYRDPHPAFWTEAHALFTRAQEYGIAQAPAKLYPSMTHQTTVERQYIAALLLEVAPTGSLLPTQTYCLQLILRHFSEHYRFADSYTASAPFFIDPAKGKPPQRWLVGLKPRPGVRFFGFGDAYAQLDMLRQAAHTSAKRPEWAEHSRIDSERYQALLDTLIEQWSENPPQRKSRRDRQVAAVVVTYGLSQVHRMLAFSRFAKEGKQVNYVEHSRFDPAVFREQSFGSVAAAKQPQPATPGQALAPMEVLNNFELAGDRDMTERWSVVDASEGGLGVVAELHRGWLRAGMLIGYRYHDSVDWRVASVRRVSRTQQGKLGVGLKCRTEPVRCARLRLQKANENDVWIASGTSADPFADAIVVDGAQPMLIVASGTYAPDRECVMTVDKRTQTIRLGELIERGVDFECISFSPQP